MSENFKIYKSIIKEKIIWIPIIITAICSYGFYITNYAIGLDDTSISRYYVEGRAPAMGRYTMSFIGKFMGIGIFSPFILEFVNVLLLISTALVCIVLFKKIVGNQISTIMYSIFACLFISFPLIHEIFIYYIGGSPGVSLGYLLTTMSALWVYTYIEKENMKKKGLLVAATIFMYFVVGLYESFALVYIMLCATILFLYLIYTDKKLKLKEIVKWILVFIIPLLLAIILRSLTFQVLTNIFEIPNHMRGIENVAWIGADNFPKQLRILKDEFLGMYVLNSLFYLPIRNYIIAMFLFLIYAIIKIIEKKNGWIALGAFGILLSPWFLMPIQGVVTPYRVNVGLSFATALAFMLVFNEIYKRIKWKWIVASIASIIIFNQSFDMNHWFYVEYVKYEYQVELTGEIYRELSEKFDLEKPVVFISNEETPSEFAKYTHIKYEDDNYQLIKKFEETMGVKLSPRFFDSKGYIYTEVPNLWLYTWGQNAFEEGAIELSKFYAMHGYEIIPGTNGNYQEAKIVNADLPGFPKRGSIVELENYIVVKLSDM